MKQKIGYLVFWIIICISVLVIIAASSYIKEYSDTHFRISHSELSEACRDTGGIVDTKNFIITVNHGVIYDTLSTSINCKYKD